MYCIGGIFMIKMIVMDLDGTLLNSKKEISHKTKETLLKAQENGIQLVLASGRPHSGMIDYGYELKMDTYDGYLISYNGAKLYSMKTQKTIWEEFIPKHDAKKILDYLENFDCIPMIQDDVYTYVNNVYKTIDIENQNNMNIIEYESRNGKYLLCEKKHLGDDLNFHIYKILIAGNPNYLQEYHKEMSEPFINEYNAMFTAPFYYEFTHKKADKGLALKACITRVGITLDEVIGFGDDLNDLPFLEMIENSVAMANNNPMIKDKVNDYCLSNEEDGIAVYLKEKNII